MKIFAIACSYLMMSFAYSQGNSWPVLKHYDQQKTDRIAMPVGGIGTGNISIAGNGQWRDVEIMNKPGMGFFGSSTPNQAPCFMVFAADGSGKKYAKALMGPVPPSDYLGSEGSVSPNAGLPRFSNVSFDAAYPFATVNLEDDQMPVSARAKVFNPFIPGDPNSSGIPVAVIRYQIKNKTNQPLTVAVGGSLDNFIGMDGSKVEFNSFNRAIVPQGTRNNRNIFKQGNAVAGIFMSSDSVDHDASAWGNIALTTSDLNKGYNISYRTEFDPKGWNANITDMWDDFSDDGNFKDTSFAVKRSSPRAGLSVKFTLAPNETKEIQFLLTWYFPNRKDWFDKETIGNYYTTLYGDAWDVAEKTLPQLPALEKKTIDFVN